MSVNKPRFPEEDWSGLSPVRDGSGDKDARPDYPDWNQVVAELGKTQKQLILRAPAGEDLDKCNVARINSSGHLVKAQANLVDNAGSMGVIVKSTVDGDMATAQTVGTVEGFAGLTRGQLYYLDDATAGGLRTSPGTVNRLIGIGKSDTELLLLLGMGTGAQGPPGEQGEEGPPGEDGEDGLGFTLLGAWSDMADYEINDVVSHDGSGYACKVAHSDQEPPNDTYWQVIGQKGDQGIQGEQGEPGEAGDNGSNGTSFQWAGLWSNVVPYVTNDVVLYTDDALYIATQSSLNSIPPSTPADWDLFLPAGVDGDDGDDGADGAGYGGTSTTSITFGTGTKVFTTQAGLAYVPGLRVRATSAASLDFMEGVVASYSGTTLTITVESESGSGTHTDWSFGIAGEPATNGAPGNDGADGTNGLTTPGGRLTLTTAVPVTTADVNGATLVYYTPYLHDQITLWNGSAWLPVAFTEVSVAPPATTSTPYDIFGYLDSGTLAIEVLTWTNATTRATALSVVNGRYVKSGDTSRLYLGSGSTGTSSGQQSDSMRVRRLFNMYNRTTRVVRRQSSTTTWTYNSSSWRQVNAEANNAIEVMIGVPGPTVDLKHTMLASMGSGAHLGYAGIGLATTQNDGLIGVVEGTAKEQMIASYSATPAAGLHTFYAVERVEVTTTQTLTSTNTASEIWGLLGTVEDM